MSDERPVEFYKEKYEDLLEKHIATRQAYVSLQVMYEDLQDTLRRDRLLYWVKVFAKALGEGTVLYAQTLADDSLREFDKRFDEEKV